MMHEKRQREKRPFDNDEEGRHECISLFLFFRFGGIILLLLVHDNDDGDDDGDDDDDEDCALQRSAR